MSQHDAKQLAKDVARNLDKRRRRRKLVVLGIVIAAIIAAVLYLGFGRGWGFGKGKGKGEGEGQGAGTGSMVAPDGSATRVCKVRISVEGIAVDGKLGSTVEAVEACSARGAAEVVITGDARQGLWDELKAAFEQAQIAFYVKNPAGSGSAGSGKAVSGSAGGSGS